MIKIVRFQQPHSHLLYSLQLLSLCKSKRRGLGSRFDKSYHKLEDVSLEEAAGAKQKLQDYVY